MRVSSIADIFRIYENFVIHIISGWLRREIYLEKRLGLGTWIIAIERCTLSTTFRLIARKWPLQAFSSYMDFKNFENSSIKGFIVKNEFLSNFSAKRSKGAPRRSVSITLWNFSNFLIFNNISSTIKETVIEETETELTKIRTNTSEQTWNHI